MPLADRPRIERERSDADRRYNDALTALDRAVVSAAAAPSADAMGAVGSALMVFLQQITPLVDTKNRSLAADADARIETVETALASIDELRARLTILQRRVEALGRVEVTAPNASAPARESLIPNPQSPIPSTASDDVTYVAFEDEFRGPDEAIGERLRSYVPIFAGRSNVLDIGCGRGEFLAALKQAGVTATGVDANAGMAATARERGLNATHGDALGYVSSLADGSLGGAIATQVVEHLEPSYLMRLLDTLARKLTPGSPLVVETINPACWLAFFSSYIRDLTHVRPVHPDTLQYLMRASGFERVEIRYSAPVAEELKMRSIAVPAEILSSGDAAAVTITQIAHAVNANASILNSLMFSHLDYAAIGYRA